MCICCMYICIMFMFIYEVFLCLQFLIIFDIIRLMLKRIDVVSMVLQIWNYFYQSDHIAVCFLYFIF